MLGGYAITVSDIQITLPDGRAFDIVRKTFPIGEGIIGGFAGSVYVGFQLLSSLSGFLRETSLGADPSSVAKQWAPIARKVFDRCPDNQQGLGSEFIIVGPHPEEDLGIPARAMPYLCSFSAPYFEPDITRGGNSAISIGRGAIIPEYVEAIKDLLDPHGNKAGSLRLEIGNTGGWASGINTAISLLLERHPAEGISSHVHTHLAAREGWKVMTSSRRMNVGTREETRIKMPPVAQSWAELMSMAERLDIDAATAKA